VKTESTKNVNNEKKKKNHLQCRGFAAKNFFESIQRNGFTPTITRKANQEKYNKKISSEIANDHLSVIV